jgi:glycerophosphoryl diester phosphodiesterase
MHTLKMFAHRGIHRVAKNENTMKAFINAMNVMDGFECDVRLSIDNEPMIIHDKTLRRTHNTPIIVSKAHSTKLIEHGIPTLEDVMHLTSKKLSKTLILDLKVHPDHIISWLNQYFPNRKSSVVFQPNTMYDGIACKFDGTDINCGCIEKKSNTFKFIPS